jgi:peptidoglycan hydrolase-like protein with peptidoglycan-binding domain
MRVKLEGNASPSLTVTATPGLALWVSGGAKPLPATPAAVARCRLVPVAPAVPASGLRLQYAPATSGSTWTTVGAAVPLASGFTSTGAGVRIELPNGTTRTEPTTVVQTTSAPRSTAWTTVSLVDPQTYLASVVAAEIGPASAPATLQAQAVAARTYATRLALVYGKTRSWDVCSVTTCQYYPGTATGNVAAGPARDRARTYPTTTAAVAATADKVLLYQGAPALTMFAAANGGFTKSGGLAYLPAKADPWDQASGSASSVWRATLPVSVLARIVPAGDRVTSVAIGGRDGHGDLGGTPSVVLIDSVSASGAAHRTSTTPARVRALWAWPTAPTGLRSDWFAILGATVPAPAASGQARGTATAVPPAPALPLKIGSRGTAVLKVQLLLKVSATAYYGPITTAAVRRWQAAKHLPATGVVDARTWTAMRLTPVIPSASRAASTSVASASARSAVSPALPLKAGSRGTAVRSVQLLLKVSATAYYGPLTTAAVRRWQAAKHLSATGVVDARTWTAMRLAPAVTAAAAKPAPVKPAPVTSILLRRGSTGSSVVRLQRILHVSSTGYYGPLTAAAVLRWQQAHRLPATGSVDARTWAALGLPRR